jgi:hypothetical protein
MHPGERYKDTVCLQLISHDVMTELLESRPRPQLLSMLVLQLCCHKCQYRQRQPACALPEVVVFGLFHDENTPRQLACHSSRLSHTPRLQSHTPNKPNPGRATQVTPLPGHTPTHPPSK